LDHAGHPRAALAILVVAGLSAFLLIADHARTGRRPDDIGGATPVEVDTRTSDSRLPQSAVQVRAEESSTTLPDSGPSVSVDVPLDPTPRSDLELLRGDFDRASSEALWAMVRSGRAEFLAEPGDAFTVEATPEDEAKISSVMSDPVLGAFRARLPEAEFADLYAMRARIRELQAKTKRR